MPLARIRGVNIENVVVSDADSRFASIIAGLAERAIDGVRLSNIRIRYRGGGTREDAMRQVPENEKSYPEPSMFGVLPVYGFFVRHARGVAFDNVDVSFEKTDARPAFLVDDVNGIDFFRTNAELSTGAKMFMLSKVTDFRLAQSRYTDDVRIAKVDKKEL